MTLDYRFRCDGQYVPGRLAEGPGAHRLAPCPDQTTIIDPSLTKMTQRLVAAGWRLGRQGADHCPSCWQQTVQELGLTTSAAPGRKRVNG